MADVDLRVQHLNHAGAVISTHSPVGESLAWGYRATDKGEISYDLSLHDDASLIAAGADSFRAYLSDFNLQMSVLGGGWQSIQGGIHTSVSFRPRSGVVEVVGRDWLEWLDQAVWFDFYEIEFNPPAFKNLKKAFNTGYKKDGTDFDANGFLSNSTYGYYVWVGELGATYETMLTDLLEISEQPLSISPVIISPQFEGFSFLESISNYQIMVQDEGTYLDHLKTIAAMGEPFGFDFSVDWNKALYFFGPRKSVSTSPDPIWVLTAENVVIDTVPDFEWTNNGPLGTYIYALGPGSPAIWDVKTDIDSEALYRRWLRLPRVGDTYQQSIFDVRYASEGLQWIFPHKDLTLSVYPNKLNPSNPGEGFMNHIGDTILFSWQIPNYHTISAHFWITQQDYHGDSAGNYICDLGLEQIYDTS